MSKLEDMKRSTANSITNFTKVMKPGEQLMKQDDRRRNSGMNDDKYSRSITYTDSDYKLLSNWFTIIVYKILYYLPDNLLHPAVVSNHQALQMITTHRLASEVLKVLQVYQN